VPNPVRGVNHASQPVPRITRQGRGQEQVRIPAAVRRLARTGTAEH